MTFHLNLQGRKPKSELNSLGKMTDLQDEAEKALSIIKQEESKNDKSSITALGRIYAFHCEAHSNDASFEIYKKICESKGTIAPKKRELNDYNTTLGTFIGEDRKFKTKRSRWKGALLYAESIGVHPEKFELAISKEDEGIVTWSSKWYQSVRPKQMELAAERDEKHLEKYVKSYPKLQSLGFDNLIEGKEAVLIQKQGGKLVLFEVRYLKPSETRRILRKPVDKIIPPNKNN